MSSFHSANQLDCSMSYIEKTARKLYPILVELKKRMVPEKKNPKNARQSANKGTGANSSALTLDHDDEDSDDQLLIDLSSERAGNGGK